jgi:DNA primase small subunit
MKPATREFLKQRFTEYYRKGNLSPPPSLEQREWGFIFFDPEYPEIRMRRHMGFGGKVELLDYIRAMVPAHAYYSSAYYGAPSAGTMAEKQWSGADLIFDLDADHITQVRDYGSMLARVREETEKLIAMLTGELGFAAREISVVFSGGRGYHIHIRDPLVRIWGSAERRELVDYVCGTGIDPRLVLSGAHEQKGWGVRFVHAVQDYIHWLRSIEPVEARTRLMAIDGVGEKSANAFLDTVRALPEPLAAEQVARLLATNRVLMAALGEEKGELQKRVRSYAALADEPVTTDTKRLIRLPTSLHGGSGFRVTPLAAGELAAFDPLTDAVVFGEREVRIEMERTLSMPLLGSVHTVRKGENRVPEALAVFLCCRGLAELSEGGTRAS